MKSARKKLALVGEEAIRQKYPWPARIPNATLFLSRWFDIHHRECFKALLEPGDVVIELGCWVGESTRFISERVYPNGRVYAVDHWKGSAEHQKDPILKNLYEVFLYNCWQHREIIVPVRETTVDGMRALHEAGVRNVKLIYVDAAHETDAVYRDLCVADELFPKAILTGDDWCWSSVRKAVKRFARERGYGIRIHRNFFRLVRPGELRPFSELRRKLGEFRLWARMKFFPI